MKIHNHSVQHLYSFFSIVALLILFLLTMSSCSLQKKPSLTEEQATIDYGLLLTTPEEPILYGERVRPVLERRCVVCHGCVDAPCQLKLSSPEGLSRGASKKRVYDGERILGAEPTRLFIDAQDTAEWRKKGFHPVLAEDAHDKEERLQQSVLYQLLRLKQRHPQPRVGMLPDNMDVGLDRKQECTTLEEFSEYSKKHPDWGMPYAMPNLSDSEYRTLVQWLAQGAGTPPPVLPSKEALPQIQNWETFLNGDSSKQKLASRYIYEHLFQAHIHFKDTPEREFYRLVRSGTPPGQDIREIATVRPYDDPGTAPFYYRLRKYHSSIVAKSHMVYELSGQRMERYRELFLAPDYTVTKLPSYEPKIASNPFKAFRQIPVRSRYYFLLDDARFTIEGFIKGPVCRGQIALSVIEDQFWVVFTNPDKDMLTNQPEFINAMADNLDIPSERGNTLRILTANSTYSRNQRAYMSARAANFEKIREPLDFESAMTYIWDGDGNNPNAALTIFRHLDSASVQEGFVGNYPESAWIIDYPMLERIHYLLVAGFNVYGNAGHQLLTRLYMDFLRIEGEDNFLAFLPADKRKQIMDSWYVGIRAGMEENLGGPVDWLTVDAVTGYKTDDPQRELYLQIKKRLGSLAGGPDNLNRCENDDCRDLAAGETKQQANRAMRTIAGIKGKTLRVFPDVAFVRVKTTDPKSDLAYTLIRNKAYLSFKSMFADQTERDYRDYEHDTLTVVEGLEGSYPNFFFVVEPDELEDFTSRYIAIVTRDDYERFVGIYGVRRTSDRFWETADWFQDKYAEQEPVLSGLFDLNRYANR